MNEREFFTAALLSCHKVLMAEFMPDDFFPDDDERLDEEVVPVAEKTAKIAALFATELTSRWRICMEVSDELDEEGMTGRPTENLTKPPPEAPPPKN